jgi:hypothetical protein
VRNHLVHVGSVAETHHLFGLQAGNFFNDFIGIARGFQGFTCADFFRGETEGLAKDFGRLRGAHVGAGDENIGIDAQFLETERGGAGFLDAFGSERTFGFGRSFGIGAVNGYAVADEIENHGLCDLFLALGAAKFGAEMEFILEEFGLASKAREIEAGAVGGANDENGFAAENLNVDASNALRVV